MQSQMCGFSLAVLYIQFGVWTCNAHDREPFSLSFFLNFSKSTHSPL